VCVQSKDTGAYDESIDVRVSPSGDVISGIDSAELDHRSSLMTSSLLLQPDDVIVTSSCVVDSDVWSGGDWMSADSSPFS